MRGSSCGAPGHPMNTMHSITSSPPSHPFWPGIVGSISAVNAIVKVSSAGFRLCKLDLARAPATGSLVSFRHGYPHEQSPSAIITLSSLSMNWLRSRGPAKVYATKRMPANLNFNLKGCKRTNNEQSGWRSTFPCSKIRCEQQHGSAGSGDALTGKGLEGGSCVVVTFELGHDGKGSVAIRTSPWADRSRSNVRLNF